MTQYGEPWRFSNERRHSDESYIVLDASGNGVCCDATDCNGYPTDEQMRRIVLCVNACAGISDETLVAVAEKRLKFHVSMPLPVEPIDT